MEKWVMSEEDSGYQPLSQTLERDEQIDLLGEQMQNYNIETSALHRKLQSKIEALRILRKEMEKFRTERDQFKLMAETLQLRYSAIKRNSDYNNGGFGGKTSVANLLHETRERNIKLTTEVEALKQKLNELQGDIQLLREKEKRRDNLTTDASKSSVQCSNQEELQWKKERTDFICYLENLKKKNAQLSFDLKALIDEKEEAITERDAYKCKAHRLNHELFVALKANEAHPKFIDIDSVLLENKYLHERLTNCESELDILTQSVNKYKTMLDTKRKKGIIKLGNSCNQDSILSHKQVKNMLEHGVDLPSKAETISDLKALCLALLDNLNDKNIALNHQRKTNKILATKIAELEQRVQALSGGAASIAINGFSPSQILLNGYSPSSVDSGNNCNGISKSEDSGAMSSEQDETNKTTSRVTDDGDDGMSSLSSESDRSILSSEYGAVEVGVDANPSSPNDLTLTSFYDFSQTNCKNSRRISSAIAKERSDNLKDLPPELAAMVQKALHELDMRDFDEVVAGEEVVYAIEIDENVGKILEKEKIPNIKAE